LCLGTCYGRTEIKRQKKKQQKLIRRKEAQDQVWTKKASHFPEATAEEGVKLKYMQFSNLF